MAGSEGEVVELVEVGELASQSGIGRVTVQKIRKAGIEYIDDLVMFNPEELAERSGLDPEKAQMVILTARRLLASKRRVKRVSTGLELEERMAKRKMFTTGLSALDELLGGGVAAWEIYEFAGEFGAGKTQLCHQLAVMVQLPPDRGGLSAKAIYVDTEGTFRPERVRAIAARFGLDGTEALSNLFVLRPVNVSELEDVVIEEVPGLVRSGAALVVIDSIIALYRAEFRGREMLARRQQRINYLIDWLKRYGYKYGVAIVYTNQVLTQPVPWGAALKIPAGGNIIAHAATHRFLMRRAGDRWIVECIDSPRIERGRSVEFVVTEGGLEDARSK